MVSRSTGVVAMVVASAIRTIMVYSFGEITPRSAPVSTINFHQASGVHQDPEAGGAAQLRPDTLRRAGYRRTFCSRDNDVSTTTSHSSRSEVDLRPHTREGAKAGNAGIVTRSSKRPLIARASRRSMRNDLPSGRAKDRMGRRSLRWRARRQPATTTMAMSRAADRDLDLSCTRRQKSRTTVNIKAMNASVRGSRAPLRRGSPERRQRGRRQAPRVMSSTPRTKAQAREFRADHPPTVRISPVPECGDRHRHADNSAKCVATSLVAKRGYRYTARIQPSAKGRRMLASDVVTAAWTR